MNMRVLLAVDADFGFHAPQELQRLFRLLGFVALVVLPQNLVGRGIDHDRLHRGRADIEPNQKLASRGRAASVRRPQL